MHYFRYTACHTLSQTNVILQNLQYKHGVVCMCVCMYVCVCLSLTAWSVDLDGLVTVQSV